jgi:hypothetical protein
MLYRARPAPVLAGTALLAGVAELVDARDLGSRDESRGGSSPSARTTSAPDWHQTKRLDQCK